MSATTPKKLQHRSNEMKNFDYSKLKWNVLTDLERTYETVKWMVENERKVDGSRVVPLPPEPERPQLTNEEIIANFNRLAEWIAPLVKGKNMPVLTDIVSVQPMSVPSNQVFHFDHESYTKEDRAQELQDEWDGIAATLLSGEVLHKYKYGGILAERGGYYTTTKDDPNKVLRFVQTLIS